MLGWGSVKRHLPTTCGVLSLIPSTTTKKKSIKKMFSGILEQSMVSTEQEHSPKEACSPQLWAAQLLIPSDGTLSLESLPLCFCQTIKVLSEKHRLKSQGARCVLKKLPRLRSASLPSTSSAAAAASKARNAALSLSYTGCFLPLKTPPTIQGETVFSS